MPHFHTHSYCACEYVSERAMHVLTFGANSCKQILFRFPQFHPKITFGSTSVWLWVSQFAICTYSQKTGNPGVLIKTFTCVGHPWPFWIPVPNKFSINRDGSHHFVYICICLSNLYPPIIFFLLFGWESFGILWGFGSLLFCSLLHIASWFWNLCVELGLSGIPWRVLLSQFLHGTICR